MVWQKMPRTAPDCSVVRSFGVSSIADSRTRFSAQAGSHTPRQDDSDNHMATTNLTLLVARIDKLEVYAIGPTSFASCENLTSRVCCTPSVATETSGRQCCRKQHVLSVSPSLLFRDGSSSCLSTELARMAPQAVGGRSCLSHASRVCHTLGWFSP